MPAHLPTLGGAHREPTTCCLPGRTYSAVSLGLGPGAWLRRPRASVPSCLPVAASWRHGFGVALLPLGTPSEQGQHFTAREEVCSLEAFGSQREPGHTVRCAQPRPRCLPGRREGAPVPQRGGCQCMCLSSLCGTGTQPSAPAPRCSALLSLPSLQGRLRERRASCPGGRTARPPCPDVDMHS